MNNQLMISYMDWWMRTEVVLWRLREKPSLWRNVIQKIEYNKKIGLDAGRRKKVCNSEEVKVDGENQTVCFDNLWSDNLH